MEGLAHMLKLLDDEEPSTQSALQAAFESTSGDLSDDIAALGIDLSPDDQAVLTNYLRPARRSRLIKAWSTPSHGVSALEEDWEQFEHLLSLIADFLHNGVTLRPSLSDLLDIWAQDFLSQQKTPTADKLRIWLFESDRLQGDNENYYHPKNSDLAHVLETGKGNPISLATLFQLIAQRCELSVTTSNYPGHFLARITVENQPNLVDCFNSGRLIPIDKLLRENKEISREAKFAVLTDCPLGISLLRIVRNLEVSFLKQNHPEDAKVFQAIAKALMP